MQSAAVRGGVRIRPEYRSRMEWVPVAIIDTEARAQRRYEPLWAHWLASHFDPDKLGHPFVVAMPAKGDRERFFAIDGQHRISAIKIAFGIDQQVECEVVRGIDLARAAELFVGRNDRRAVRVIDKFKTGVTAQNPECVGITKIVTDLGLVINDASQEPRTICAIAAIRVLYGLGPDEQRGVILRTVLRLIIKVWGTDASVFNGEVLKGLGYVLARHGDDLDMEIFERKLTSTSGGALGLLGKARAYREAAGGSIAQNVARAIVTIYNSGRTKSRLSAWGEKA